MPATFRGKIEDITIENIGSIHQKKVIKIVADTESIFVDFRSEKTLLYTDGLEVGDKVECIYNQSANISPRGTKFNNLIGQSISKIG